MMKYEVLLGYINLLKLNFDGILTAENPVFVNVVFRFVNYSYLKTAIPN